MWACGQCTWAARTRPTRWMRCCGCGWRWCAARAWGAGWLLRCCGAKPLAIHLDRRAHEWRQLRVQLLEGGVELRVVVVQRAQPAQHLRRGLEEVAQVLVPAREVCLHRRAAGRLVHLAEQVAVDALALGLDLRLLGG